MSAYARGEDQRDQDGETSRGSDEVLRRAAFFSHIAPLDSLTRDQRRRVASVSSERHFEEDEMLLVEGGPPGTHLLIVKDGALELISQGQVIDIVASGGVLGHPTLVTGLPPELSVRARTAGTLYAIPHNTALALLSSAEGVAFVARSMRERLVQTAQMVRPAADTANVPVRDLIRGPLVTCTPDTPIRDAARIMSEGGVTAILVKTRKGPGIVTNADLRDKVVSVDLSPHEPVSRIMTQPVKTIGGEQLAEEASIEMLQSGVNHLAVVDARGRVQGIIWAGSLMTPMELSPFALRRSISAAHNEEELVKAAQRIPRIFLALLDARLDAQTISRVLTAVSDALTRRLLQLGIARHGEPPVPFAWLALGSGARGELTVASDQDNALAYADTDDPEVDAYFERLAADVNDGLERSGFEPDLSGVLARDSHWRMSQSQWLQVFTACFEQWSFTHIMRASVSFDFRQVAGDFDSVPSLVNALLAAPDHPAFLNRLARTVTDIRSPLGFRQRLSGPVDIKKSALLPIENIARYYALANRITVSATVDRLRAVGELDVLADGETQRLLEAYRFSWQLRLRHHADALREGQHPGDVIDTSTLPPLTRAELREALHTIATAQKRVPRFLSPEAFTKR